MSDWLIKVDGQGNAVGHVPSADVENPLTAAKGDKAWYRAATLTKPAPGTGQALSGPVYDIDAGTITYSLASKDSAVLKQAVASYAENLLAAGVVLSASTVSEGTRFRCDDSAVNRLHALCVAADRLETASQPVSVTFRTHAGVAITVSSAAQCWAIYDEVVGYAAAVLAVSASAQASPPLDPATVSWPSDGS